AAVPGVALGTTGVALELGVGCGATVDDGVASCGGVPADAGTDGTGVATALGVGLAFGCMFIAFLSVSFPSGPNTILIPLFCASFITSCGTATAYTQVDPTNLSPCLLTSHRAKSGAPRMISTSDSLMPARTVSYCRIQRSNERSDMYGTRMPVRNWS